MNSETKVTDTEKHENVKELLNNLLHKKILDQHEKSNDICNKSSDSTEEKPRPDIFLNQGESSNEPIIEITENCDDEMTNESEDDYNQYLLHHILNEKKKELLRNTEVMQFLQSKLRFN
ncbi:hypothetical protein CBL_11692 [Carabus blaptoides fortunei]